MKLQGLSVPHSTFRWRLFKQKLKSVLILRKKYQALSDLSRLDTHLGCHSSYSINNLEGNAKVAFFCTKKSFIFSNCIREWLHITHTSKNINVSKMHLLAAMPRQLLLLCSKSRKLSSGWKAWRSPLYPYQCLLAQLELKVWKAVRRTRVLLPPSKA